MPVISTASPHSCRLKAITTPLPVRSILETHRSCTANSAGTFLAQDCGVILDQCSINKPAPHNSDILIGQSSPWCLMATPNMVDMAENIISTPHDVTSLAFLSVPLQTCPRTASRKSPQRCVCLPPSSRSTSTTTASNASQKPLSICRCWRTLTSGAFLLTFALSLWSLLCSFRQTTTGDFVSLKRCLFPFPPSHRRNMHDKETFPLLLKLNSQPPHTHS